MLKYLLIILLLPICLYAVDCGDGYEWRAKVTKKNFKEYEKCMSEAERKEGKIFTNKTSHDDVYRTYFVSHKQQDECIQLDKYLSGYSFPGKFFAKLLKIKFDKTKSEYDKENQRYVMKIETDKTLQEIVFYPNKTIKEVFKFYNKDSYKLFKGVPDNNTQLLFSSYEPFDMCRCYFWSNENKFYEIDGPGECRNDRMYIKDETGVYVYYQGSCATDFL